LNVLDLLTTTLVVSEIGYTAEMNPFLRWVIFNFGMVGVFLVKVVGVAMVFKMKRLIRPIVLFVINVIFMAVVIGNTMNYIMITS